MKENTKFGYIIMLIKDMENCKKNEGEWNKTPEERESFGCELNSPSAFALVAFTNFEGRLEIEN